MRKTSISLCVLGTALIACVELTAAPFTESAEVLVTSEAGDKIARKENVQFRLGQAEGTVVRVYPERLKQTIDGIGSSFTESSAFVLAHLEPSKRTELMRKLFGSDGANFTLCRTHIGACDFTVEGRYSYADVPDDTDLEHFSIESDQTGFDPAQYRGVKDPAYDLLPMIKEALAIKKSQASPELRIIASAWTAPAWMKDIQDWYIKGTPQNNYQGTGGSLKPEHQSTYARYLIKYLDAYQKQGIPIWGMTPVNEPHGNNGQWESMHFSAETQREFVKNYLGPALKDSRHSETRLLVYDQNRDELEHWAEVLLADEETAPYIYGIAVHWYSSTFKVYEDALERVHTKYPEFRVVHTEGCIDDLGKDAPNGIKDPELFKESGWFQNDAFWWNPNATDWAYTATWAGAGVVDHPAYTPVHRYARNIIVSLDHWMTGWVDWNVVLDAQGGPNHVGNFCGAPVMIDTEKGEIYFTPIYHILAQFSRTIRPGDKAVETQKTLVELGADDLHACATINSDQLLSVQLLNTTKESIKIKLQIGERFADVQVPANAVQTVRIQL